MQNIKFKYWFIYKFRKPILEWLYARLSEIGAAFENLASKVGGRTHGGPQAHYVPPTKAERADKIKKLGIAASMLFAGIALLLLIFLFAKYYYTVSDSSISFDDWNSSSGSFWGAVLGAFIAGLATIITTALVIQRSYKIDYHRERLEVMPVLDISVYRKSVAYQGEETETELSEEAHCPVEIHGAVATSGNDIRLYQIRNVGRGIAYRIESIGFAQEYEEMRYNSILPVGESFIMGHYKIEEGLASLNFYDLYENQYRQMFSISPNGITTYPPELIRKTERVRYTQ